MVEPYVRRVRRQSSSLGAWAGHKRSLIGGGALRNRPAIQGGDLQGRGPQCFRAQIFGLPRQMRDVALKGGGGNLPPLSEPYRAAYADAIAVATIDAGVPTAATALTLEAFARRAVATGFAFGATLAVAFGAVFTVLTALSTLATLTAFAGLPAFFDGVAFTAALAFALAAVAFSLAAAISSLAAAFSTAWAARADSCRFFKSAAALAMAFLPAATCFVRSARSLSSCF